MSIEIKSTLKTDDLLEALKQFPQNIQKNVLNGALRAGCKPILDAAKENVPKDTGNLKKSLGIIKRRSRDKSKVRFSVTPRRGGKYDGFYAHMIEFGTSKMSAQPFMRPAFENQDNQSIEAAKKYMAKRIDKEVEKAKNGRS
ncbi:HK97-gp10 family putative phage morphogenesis protein [Arcobacter arenosus]|uniref:HK97 gp10 family phage protein n=1 Tax=Arcobacter arenosus TaxID=2576037 RepID=A0A5R8Y5H9_9BACT|nr:HK97-gp10 family putative phage morphogenesis protein [Arcobacter arenosus]TLP41040.1 HK97 gp10 family phage protein [Arcobacter arenosus]